MRKDSSYRVPGLVCRGVKWLFALDEVLVMVLEILLQRPQKLSIIGEIGHIIVGEAILLQPVIVIEDLKFYAFDEKPNGFGR